MGPALPDALVFVPRMRGASLSRTGKSSLLASVQGALSALVVAKQMGRLFDPSGEAARQDVLAATGVSAPRENEDPSYEARVAYSKAEENLTGREHDGIRGRRSEKGKWGRGNLQWY